MVIVKSIPVRNYVSPYLRTRKRDLFIRLVSLFQRLEFQSSYRTVRCSRLEAALRRFAALDASARSNSLSSNQTIQPSFSEILGQPFTPSTPNSPTIPYSKDYVDSLPSPFCTPTDDFFKGGI